MIKLILAWITISSMVFAGDFVIVDSLTSANITGQYGKHSAIIPVKTFDGMYIIPTDVLVSNDLRAAWGKINSAITANGTEDIPVLPEIGQQVLINKLYRSADGVVKCRQTHNRTIYPPHETPALFSFFRENQTDTLDWIPNEEVRRGWARVYDGNTYICLQAHMTQSDWTPTATVGVLWEMVTQPSAVWAVGIAYKIGDEVTYQGLLYRCRQAHTSLVGWEPPKVLALWLPI